MSLRYWTTKVTLSTQKTHFCTTRRCCVCDKRPAFREAVSRVNSWAVCVTLPQIMGREVPSCTGLPNTQGIMLAPRSPLAHTFCPLQKLVVGIVVARILHPVHSIPLRPLLHQAEVSSIVTHSIVPLRVRYHALIHNASAEPTHAGRAGRARCSEGPLTVRNSIFCQHVRMLTRGDFLNSPY